MAMPKIIRELASRLEIPVVPQQRSIYAMRNGFPVQFLETLKKNKTTLLGVIRFDEADKDKLIRDTLSKDQTIKQSGLKVHNIDVTNGVITLNWVKGITGYPKTERILGQYNSVLEGIKALVTGPGLKCRVCQSSSIDAPVLINGVVDRMCQACIEKMQQEMDKLKAAYQALPTNYLLAVITAVILVVVGAAVWSAIIISTHRMFWVLAVLIGAGIGWGTSKAAGKGGLPVQAIVFSGTLISILLGMIVYVGYLVQEEAVKTGGTVDWAEFFRNVPYFLLQIKEDLLFSLGGALIGAIVAASKAAKPKLLMKVEQ